jgi:6-phosphogluconolactonase
VLPGHGKDPNSSPQAGGHAQSSAHAHCAVIDPSGQYVLVCDKGTDQIYVYRLSAGLERVSTYRFEDEIGPRHVAFDTSTGRAFVTCEFSSELASFDFDPATGELGLLYRVSTVDDTYIGLNEPADVRVHPDGQFVYVNNRGEDSVAWFSVGQSGELTRRGHVSISKSIHPGLAARSFAFDPTGNFVLVADRPANLVRSYAVDRSNGCLHALTEAPVRDPAFIEFVALPSSE